MKLLFTNESLRRKIASDLDDEPTAGGEALGMIGFEWPSFGGLLMNRVRFQRFNGPLGSSPKPLHWSPCHPATLARFKATLTCPNGHALTLREHSVRPDGLVDPSVVCPTATCRFHAYVKLDGWDYGRVP